MDLAPIGGVTGASPASAKKAPAAATIKAAREFEAIFLQQLIQSMRQASPTAASGMLSGKKTRVYQDMLDQEMAKAMARSGGLGIADFMIRDMTRRQGPAAKKDSSPPGGVPMLTAETNQLQGGAR
jgi:flagellar protein FlgJ